MAGGAQLIGDLLQGAFGGDNIDPHQAAISLGYDHIKTTDDNGKPLDKPSYFNSKTGDITDDPLSKLPLKQPGFWQRAFAPNDASRANSINSSFATQPTFASQANRTRLGIGGDNAALAISNANKPVGEMDPQAAGLLMDENPDANNIANLSAQVPQERAGETVANLVASKAAAKSALKRSIASDALGNPESSAETEAGLYSAQKPELINRQTEAEATGAAGIPTLRPTVARSEMLNELTRQERNVPQALANDYQLSLGEGRRMPETQKILDNKTDIETGLSNVGPMPPGMGSQIKTDPITGAKSLVAGQTGFPLSPGERQSVIMNNALGGSGKAVGKSGVSKATYVAQPSLPITSGNIPTEDKAPPAKVDDSEDNTPKLTPAQAKAKTQQAGIRGGLAEDTEGNIWYNGNIIKGPALDKQQEPDIDFRHINDHLMEGLLK